MTGILVLVREPSFWWELENQLGWCWLMLGTLHVRPRLSASRVNANVIGRYASINH